MVQTYSSDTLPFDNAYFAKQHKHLSEHQYNMYVPYVTIKVIGKKNYPDPQHQVGEN